MENKLLTIKELQELLSLSHTTIYKFMKEGLPYFKVGDSLRFKRDDIESWLDAQKIVKNEE